MRLYILSLTNPKILLTLLFGLILTNHTACNNSADLPDGIWRAALKTEIGKEIPFNFEITDSLDRKIIYLVNGEERLKVDDITINDDSIFIKLPLFDSEIRAQISKGELKGKWIKHLADKNSVMGFAAKAGISWRFFEKSENSNHNISGRWSTVFVSHGGKETIAVGEFEQKNQKLTGTFLTPTGDYRFLEGSISDNKIFLSTFDGSNAYLFTGVLQNDVAITDGKFYSGPKSVKQWTAKKDEMASLPDAYSLTKLKSGEEKITFSFPDLDGKKVSLSDTRFKNKIVVVQLLGSWCPNCMDETAYLSSFYEKYKNEGVEIIGLAYERTNDFKRSKDRIEQLKKRFNIGYPLLITGYTDKEVLKSMPALNEFKAFPTTLIIDKKGVVRKIHTGFSGPGTGQHYTNFIKEFELQIKELLKETNRD